MRNRDGISGYPGGLIGNLTFVVLVVVFVTVLSAAPSRAQVSESVDNSVNDSFNTDVTIDAQSQECAAIVQQFNNAVAGDAVSADDAVAATATAVDAPASVVQSCIQADGDVVIGSADDDGNDDGNDDEDITEADAEEVSAATEETDDGAVMNDSTSAAQEQYGDGTSAGQEDSSCAVALDPRVTIAENGRGEATLNVESSQEGDYRITYDLGDQTDELNIQIPSSQTGSTLPINFDVTENGSRIVSLSAATYQIIVTPESENSDDGGYTVEVSRCGASSDDPNNAMDDTFDSRKQLANTGGTTETASFILSSAALIPFGVALLVSGVIAAFWLRNASNRH